MSRLDRERRNGCCWIALLGSVFLGAAISASQHPPVLDEGQPAPTAQGAGR